MKFLYKKIMTYCCRIFCVKVDKKDIEMELGNPQNYRTRGFKTAADYGIYASEKIQLPHIDCLMVRELVPGALEYIHGILNYGFYESLA